MGIKFTEPWENSWSIKRTSYTISNTNKFSYVDEVVVLSTPFKYFYNVEVPVRIIDWVIKALIEAKKELEEGKEKNGKASN